MVDDATDIVEEVVEGAVRATVTDLIVGTFDDRGRLFSPYIERGSDNIPRSVNIPSAADMRGMSTAELSNVASRFGYVQGLENDMAIHAGFLQRFNIQPGDPRWDAEMGNLKDNIGRSLLGHTRRLAQRHEQITAIGGNMNQRVIYINESEEPCDECEPLGGQEGTYAEFVAEGKLPGDRCLGGNNCLCTIMAVD